MSDSCGSRRGAKEFVQVSSRSVVKVTADERILEVLRNADVSTVGELRALSGEELVALPGLDKARATQLTKDLAKYTHAPSPDGWRDAINEMPDEIVSDWQLRPLSRVCRGKDGLRAVDLLEDAGVRTVGGVILYDWVNLKELLGDDVELARYVAICVRLAVPNDWIEQVGLEDTHWLLMAGTW